MNTRRELLEEVAAERDRLQEALDEHQAHYVDPSDYADLLARLGAVEALVREADASGRHVNGYGYVLARELRAALDGEAERQ